MGMYEDKFINGENIRDSWNATVREFIHNINLIAQNITINLIAFLFVILQYVIYVLILLIVAKYVWQLAKLIWKK